MRRIDLIYDAIKILDKGNGVTTIEVSNYLSLERSNVSKDLNLLVKNNSLYKSNSRPVRYFLDNPSNINITPKSSIDILGYYYPSLLSSIKLAKTAIVYPPNGMNSLIVGDTGVGKSMLAKLMHDYANSLSPEKEIPFLHFNCSDYANNPQLLSAHLFGVKKGTFTGATENRAGLIEQADGGILFLDEIHNLPSEGQEMLFVFMDTGYFKRFGEISKKTYSSARIICATNKDINSSLLNTFIRRIPIKIYLPGLNERSLEERLTLIEFFIKEESSRLEIPISVSYNSMLCLLSYTCQYNIGQLKNDITLAIANSYLDYFINDKKEIRLNSPDLPVLLKEMLNTPLLKERELLNTLECQDEYFVYSKDSELTNYSFLKEKHIILNSFKKLMNEISATEIDISTITTLVIDYLNIINDNSSNYHYSLDNSAFEAVLYNISTSNNKLNTYINNKKFNLLFHIHMDMIYERINLINHNFIPLLNKLKSCFIDEYSSALELKDIIEKVYNINLSTTEILFLTIFSIYLTQKNPKVLSM